MSFLLRDGAPARRSPLPPLCLSHRITLSLLAAGTALATITFAPSTTQHSAPLDLEPTPRMSGRFSAVDAAPYFAQSWVSPSNHTPSAHSSAICALPSGDLFAVWYGGGREGAADVALFTARLARGSAHWSPPVNTVDRALAEEELDRTIKKVGNAVIFPDGSGNLWMVYVSVSVGGWSGSSLNVKTSRDEGRTWGESQRLTLNPFFNLSSLVRNKPIYARDGRIGLPIYHEMAIKYPQMLWLTPGADGSVADYRIRNLSHQSGLIQPTLVPLSGDRVLMLLRDHGATRSMHAAFSDDNGWTWSEATPSGLPNPDAALDALRLRDGRILVVYNDAASGRENLRVGLSADEGRTWRAGPVFEHAPLEEFSYPNLTEDHQGRIHVTYTWKRVRIKHVTFNLAWLEEQQLGEANASQ